VSSGLAILLFTVLPEFFPHNPTDSPFSTFQSVPTAVKPQVKKCEEVVCTPDLANCPKEEMKLKDSYGEVLGCASACFAHVGNSDQQCCVSQRLAGSCHSTVLRREWIQTEPYGDSTKCTPDLIIGYDYFKSACKNSYAYFVSAYLGSSWRRNAHGKRRLQQDRASGTVDMLCPSEGDPGFTLTFCPDGDGGKSNSTEGAGE